MNVSSDDKVLSFEFDEGLLRTVQDALGDLKDESFKVLKNAVNKTAKQAKDDLAEQARKSYVVQKSRFTKAMKTKNATTANPTATIDITGEQLELKDFKVSPSTYRTGAERPDIYKAKVLVASSLKRLESNTKAFLVKFKSGHVSVAQRVGKSRYPIKKLLSSSIPAMVGSKEQVYGVIEPEIYVNMMDNLLAEIKKVTG
jgi:hypothetical protein